MGKRVGKRRSVGLVVGVALSVLQLVPIARADVGASQFQPRVSYNVGGGAIGLAGGDFNGDGRNDVAVGNNNMGQLKVFFGEPGGGLGSPISWNLGSAHARRMTAGDLNADGRSDIMYDGAGVNVAYGQAGNTFQLTNHPLGGYKQAVADLNNDGQMDMVVTESAFLRAYFGQTSGGFTQQTFFADTNALGIAIDDFNGDGRNDIVTTHNDFNNSITLMLALAGGGFSNTKLTGGRSESILSADFNNDGRPDIAYAVFGSGAGVKLNQGNGNFSPTTFFPTVQSALDITAGDFNHDGDVDLALVTVNFSSVSLLLGRGDGTFEPHTNLFASANGSASVLAMDFNGDGLDDIAVASASGPNLDVFYQIPEPASATPLALIGGITALRRVRRCASCGA